MKRLILITFAASLFIFASCEKEELPTQGGLKFDKSLDRNSNPGQHDLVESSETTTFRVVSTDSTSIPSAPARIIPSRIPLDPGKPLNPVKPVLP